MGKPSTSSDVRRRDDKRARSLYCESSAAQRSGRPLVERAVQLVERAEGNGDLALLAALAIALRADLDRCAEAVVQGLFEAHYVARLVVLGSQPPRLAAGMAAGLALDQLLGFAHRELFAAT